MQPTLSSMHRLRVKSGKVTFDRTTELDHCAVDDPKRDCTLDDL